jgi:O-antigen/teichoic acid export membrane protein
MHLDTSNPLFRKASAPWYDGNMACGILLAAMLLVGLFSWAGIYVAHNNPDYHPFLWVPITLLISSLLVAGLVVFRLIHRSYGWHMQNRDL